MDLYQQIFFSTIALAFGLLHTFLFLYNRRLRSNLYFAIFLILYTLSIFFDFQVSMAQDGVSELLFLRIHRLVMPLSSIFLLLFSYSITETKLTKQFWFISAGLIVTSGFAVYRPIENFNYVLILMMAMMIEMINIFIRPVVKKVDGAWIVANGLILLLLFSCYDLLLDLNLMKPVYNITNGYPYGFICLIIAISVYLARDYAKMNARILEEERKTKESEIRQRLLEAEDVRKSKELEEARKLQLSMLPTRLFNIKNLDLCFEMRTASEVGGDYYDYQFGPDATMTIALGDATGHGMKAGIMVSIIKSLFITHAKNLAMPVFFNECSRTIRQMRLGNLYMAMLLMEIKDGNLEISSAGMPPVLIYRAANKTIEEITLKALPLGAVESFQYQTIKTTLASGDTVFMMSDGFPELFNENKETLDYWRVKEIFQRLADQPACQIVRDLFLEVDKWRNGLLQNDDITFIVFKSTT
ncbi:SpoIIE family protein phosphatase [candidate division KSB1 bacterium]|nr:SpoIIE family protein phosphatase [candidate division KSB1 bacterium]